MSASAAALPPSAARKPPGPLEEVPRIALPGRADVAWLAIATCGVNVLALALPLLMLQVFDRILPFRSMDTLLLLVAGTVAAVAGEALLRLMRSYMLVWAATRFEHRSMCDAMSRLLATPPERLESGTAERFKAIVSLKDYFSGQSFVQVLDLPFTALYLALVAMIGGPMVAVPIVFAGLFAILNYRMGRQHGALFRERQGADRRRNNFLLETLSGIHTVKAMAMEAFMLRRYERLQEGCANLTRRLAEALDVSSGLGALFSPLLTILVVAVGGALLVLGQLTNGELAACIMLILRSLGPMQRAGSLWIGHQQVRVLHEEIRPLFSHPPLAERPTARPDTAAAGRLELRAAGYRLPGAPAAIIEGVSVAITPGETVVIRGANGSGRSTLLQMLAGLLPPSSGEVLLDGEPLTALDPAALREAVAYVPENAQLFEGTILQNISGFDPSRVEHALKVAAALGLDKYVSRLPRGWDSAVGNAAADTTPVGHRQRIAMVRALAGGARVVLFDGANVNMDSEGDAALRSYLEAEKGRTTFIIVTLRPSLQRLADRVLVMESGRLVLDLPASDPQAWASLEAAPAEAAPGDAPDSPAEAPVLAPAPLTPEARWELTRLAILNSFSRPGDLALCLTELLKALGWKGEPRDVAEALPYFEDTLDLSGLLNCLAQVGFHGSGARLTLREIDPRLLPCLFIPDRGAAVVLLSADRGVLRAYDPVVGGPRDLAGSLKGEAYFFTPAERDDGPQAGWAMRMLSRLRPLVAHAMFAALVFGLVMLPAPFFVMAVFGYIMPSGSLVNLAYLTAGACAAVLIGAFFVVYRASILSYIAGRIDYLFGTAVFKQIMALPPSMSESASIGAQIARLSSFESIRELFTGPLMSTLLESPALLAFVIALGVVNPAALLAVGVTLALYVLLYSLCNAAVNRHVAEFARRSTQRHEFLVEASAKLRTIREFGGEQIWMARFRELSAATTMAGYRVGRISSALSAGSYLMTTLGTLAVLVVSIVFAASNIFGVGVVIASMMLTWRIIGPIQTAFINLTRIDRVRNATSQVDRLMALRAERSGGPSATMARSFTGRVELERVSFRYSLDTDPALVGASFVVEPGTLVAVTGPNGSGKSTLLKLLAGLYQPQAGSIRLDGMDLRQIDPLELRRAIGYVPQESSLFRGTIAQNLRLVRPAATDDELQRALALAGAMNDVAILPEGIGTRVGDGATERLSASLRQKLALARAYLTRAPVLLFDEPAAALDMDGDRWFVEALRKLKGYSSIFLVTHRPSHIRLADMAVVLQGGFVRSIGTPAEALKRMGIKL